MPTTSKKLEWCIVRLGSDYNWWVHEISDPIHWDVDGLGIIDPRQMSHILELLEPLNEYGLQADIIENAFFAFRMEKDLGKGDLRLVRYDGSILESEEPLFCLPDILNEEKGPYADLLDHIITVRVRMLNNLIDFEENLSIDEIEEELRERQNRDFIEGSTTHFFDELTTILEYVPEGYELEGEEKTKSTEEEIDSDLSDFDSDEEEIEADETMKWGDEEEEEDFDMENDFEDGFDNR